MTTPTEEFWNPELRAEMVPAIVRLEHLVTEARKLEWREEARKVLAGEYANADRSTRKSLWIGMAHLGYPECQQAAEMLMRRGL